MLKHAFKEWAVICKALAEGRQAIILRKGGIAEKGDTFEPEHTRFWLFPTYVHQQQQGVKEEASDLLAQAEANRPAAATIRISHFAEVQGIYQVHNLPAALMLQGMHLWVERTVTDRFHYRRPGLYVLAVRVHRARQTFDLPDTAYYAGCRSWVELERELPDEDAAPVLDDDAFRDVLRRLDVLLNPTALA